MHNWKRRLEKRYIELYNLSVHLKKYIFEKIVWNMKIIKYERALIFSNFPDHL